MASSPFVRCILRRSNIPKIHAKCREMSTTSSQKAESFINKEWTVTLGSSDDDKSHIIKLNNITIKTPMKKLLKIHDETLAIAIANEWRAQAKKKKPDIKSMHLTTLAYTAIDNPFNETNEQLTESIIEYLKFDTVRFRDTSQEELFKRQSRHWDPVMGWFEHEFSCQVPVDYGHITNTISVPQNTLATMSRYLNSHSRWPLVGLKYVTENLRSLILTTCLTRRFLSIEDVVGLARLETKFQTDKWSEVEWEHSIDEQILMSRASAGSLFYHLALDTPTDVTPQ